MEVRAGSSGSALHHIHSATVVRTVTVPWMKGTRAEMPCTATRGLRCPILTAIASLFYSHDSEGRLIRGRHMAGWRGALDRLLTQRRCVKT